MSVVPQQLFSIEALESRQLLSGDLSLADPFTFPGSMSTAASAAASASVLQSGWSDGDIGAPALGGSANFDMPSDTWTLAGSGADIYGTSDQFHFTSRPMSGDGSAIAY